MFDCSLTPTGMSVVLPPQKRQRKDSNHGDPRARSEYWFEDGNIILQAEHALFRVHRSMLSRYSPIFKDTFAIPQPPSQENELIDGCPVMALSDTAEDLTNIISLLYDSDKPVMLSFGLPAKVIGSMLRLGRKYGIAHLEKMALQALVINLPTTLAGWDSLHSLHTKQSLKTIAEFITIAHEFCLFTKLPAAYALYIRLEKGCPDDLFKDGHIPESARTHCLVGYVKILKYIKRSSVNAFCPPFLPSKECSGRGKCKANRWETIKDLPVWAMDSEDESFGIFDSWKLRGTEDLCSQCRAEAKSVTDKVRTEFWAVLPTFFGLPSWTVLKDEF